MSDKKNRQPTTAEVEVLQILWRNGPSSVRDVHEFFAEGRDVKYTTTLKTMQVMHERGFLTRESQGRKHIYAAAVEREKDPGRPPGHVPPAHLRRLGGGACHAGAR